MNHWIAALATLGLTPLIARLYPSLPNRERGASVPLAGGVAVFLGAAVSVYFGPEAALLPFLGALMLGTIDDGAPLSPGVKFTGQLFVAWACSYFVPDQDPWVLIPLVVVAMNAVNTYDNADGAAAGLGAIALVGTPIGAALLGFLPWNLAKTRRWKGVYLGDAGSHVVGVAIALTPGARWFLLVPLLDLARLSVLRLRSGSRPWIGDQRHLAHRLAAAGLGSVSIAFLLAILVAPCRMEALPYGPLASALLFVLAIRFTRDPCSPQGPPG